MTATATMEAVIIADCGSATTRATLLELVDDRLRYVAQGESPTTAEPPIADVSVGVRNALAALEQATARRFTARNRPIVPQGDDGNGADALLATVTATPALRLAILTTGSDSLSLALLDSARRLPLTVLPTVTVDGADQDEDRTRETVAAIARYQPDLLLLVATAAREGSTTRLLSLATRIVAAASVAGYESYPAVLFVGDERLHDAITTSFSGGTELGLIATGPADVATLTALVEQELLEFVNQRVIARRPGFDVVRDWTTGTLLARSRALDLVNRFMAAHLDREVLTVEFTDGATFCWARGDEHRGLTEPALDLAIGAGNLLMTLLPADVLRWLPFECDEDALVRWILNRALRPFTLPLNRRDQLIEAAIARELLRTGVAELQTAGSEPLTPEVIVGGSFFARWPDPGLALLTLLDGLQPRPASGLVRVALDRNGLLPAIGAMGVVEPERAAEAFAYDGVIDLGVAIALSGPTGDTVNGQIRYHTGETQTFSATVGTLTRVPLDPARRVSGLRLTPTGRVTIGAGAAGVPASFDEPELPRGSLVGLLLDGRGQPLDLPAANQERRERLAAWLTAVTA